MYTARSSYQELAQLDTEDGIDPDDASNNSNNTEEEEEECEMRVKELFFEGEITFAITFNPVAAGKSFGEPGDFCELHLTNPPYSPPEFA
jgi:hypothetical protein